MMQMECCGVVHFTDYETVFTNFSVPVSCCNTTNPLASQCPDIVRNTDQMINQTGLIYSEVSASSHLTNCMLLHYICYYRVVCHMCSHSTTTCSLLLLQSPLLLLACRYLLQQLHM